ncbi:C4-dicarboxylate ABC transporter permease, partial [Halomonas sp. FL8]|nr:C4-dicarboxylate ABC transporter permease [Halomonas sp. FL8]MCP1344824.1 C4-dicarboxylate ABC transporter permease [Halomonas sp. FL8]MCP1363541.1 C4-dicarboxylate ABC transporter permease [Halomonas sp. BBD45]MCP1363605.1 C4-dicarboxylate ABC transporter permease [Halomonas sp. BBD45]
FYLKGVAPPEISLKDIFVSLLPFIAIQLCVLFALLFWPNLAMWLV